jgi:hypothetical protein
MPHGERTYLLEGPIVLDKNPEEILAEPYNMPAGFEWSDVGISNADQRK